MIAPLRGSNIDRRSLIVAPAKHSGIDSIQNSIALLTPEPWCDQLDRTLAPVISTRPTRGAEIMNDRASTLAANIGICHINGPRAIAIQYAIRTDSFLTAHQDSARAARTTIAVRPIPAVGVGATTASATASPSTTAPPSTTTLLLPWHNSKIRGLPTRRSLLSCRALSLSKGAPPCKANAQWSLAPY